MAHKALVGGTAYGIKGGKCLVNGTGYDVKGGMALIGGTGYGIKFSSPVAVTITGAGQGAVMSGTPPIYASVTINGTEYTTAQEELVVQTGDVIVLYAKSTSSTGYTNAQITIDGNSVAVGAELSYEWTVPDDITSATINLSYKKVSSYYSGIISVTTN